MQTSAVNLLVMALLIALGVHPIVYAESAPVAASQTSVDQPNAINPSQEKIQKILDNIASQAEALNFIKDDVTQLNSDIKKAKNEERAVLRDQRRRKLAEIRDGLEELVRSINELGSMEQDTRVSREVAAAYAREVSAWLKSDISESMKLLADLDELVKKASESDAPELRQEIANERQAVDEALTALLENSDRMELLGLDCMLDLKYLDDTLVQRADNLVARLQYLVQQRDGLRKQVAGAGEDEKKLLKEKVASLDRRISATADNLKITIELMNERKLEAV